MKQSCKLFETLTRANMKLDDKHQPTSYNCDEQCPWFGKCFYSCECPPENQYLQGIMGGWQKYSKFEMNDKTCTIDFNGCICIGILHLIVPTKIDDIVIFRIIKKHKDNNTYNIRYVCTQSNKSQLCANIKELNNHLDKKCQYVGRPIEISDFYNKKEEK